MIRTFLGYEPSESLVWDAIIVFTFLPVTAVCVWAAIPSCDAIWLSRAGGALSIGSFLVIQRTQSLQLRRIYCHQEKFTPHATSRDLRLSNSHSVIQGCAISVALIGTATWAFADVSLPLVCGK